jgi:pimeloyl-ACP methyl ester carboxylesterase
VIALDRPGYGLSDFRPGRAISDWPADVAQAADALGIGRFSVAGASGGGPYALACAREIPDRVVRAAVISGVGPFQVPGSTAGMRWQNRVGFRLCARFPALAQISSPTSRRRSGTAVTARRAATRRCFAARATC